MQQVWRTPNGGDKMEAAPRGFNFIKQKIFGYFKKIAPPETVSRTRYRIGLVIFVIPFIMGWLLPYFTDLIGSYNEFGMYINIGGDILLITSLFILGGTSGIKSERFSFRMPK